MPPRRKKAPPLCRQHFPNGLADQPADATVVSCEHGAWPVERPDPPADPDAAEDDGEGEGV